MKMHSPGHSSADSMTASSMAGGHVGEALGAARVGEDLVAFLDVGEAVVEQGEDVGRDLLAEPVAGAEILVDPDLHGAVASLIGRVGRTARGAGLHRGSVADPAINKGTLTSPDGLSHVQPCDSSRSGASPPNRRNRRSVRAGPQACRTSDAVAETDDESASGTRRMDRHGIPSTSGDQ